MALLLHSSWMVIFIFLYLVGLKKPEILFEQLFRALARVRKHLYFILDWVLVEKLNGTDVERLACCRHNEAGKMKSPKDKSVMSFAFYLWGTDLCYISLLCCGQKKRARVRGCVFMQKEKKRCERELKWTSGSDITELQNSPSTMMLNLNVSSVLMSVGVYIFLCLKGWLLIVSSKVCKGLIIRLTKIFIANWKKMTQVI